MTEEELNNKRVELEQAANELAKKNGVSKVHVVLQYDLAKEKEYVTFLAEPNFSTKLRANDMMVTNGAYTAAGMLLDACIIKESSCIESYTEASNESIDKVKLGIADYILSNMLNRFSDQFKKKDVNIK